MVNKILQLKQQGLNSLQISNCLSVNKEYIDHILLDEYLKKIKRGKINKIGVKQALCNFHKDPNTTLKKESKSCNCCSVQLGKTFLNAGIYLYHKSTRISNKFSELDFTEMTKLFNLGYSLKEIAKKYHTQGCVISNFLRKRGFNTNRSTIYEDFFENINSEEKAY